MKLITLILLALASARAVAAPCEVGSYRMTDGTSLDIAAGKSEKLRWRRPDGLTGELTPDGMYEFETLADGERVSTRQPEGYLTLMADFIAGKPLATNYGSAVLSSGQSVRRVNHW